MNPEVNRLYDMPLETIKQTWETKGPAIEAAELETFREKNARVWMASQPDYKPPPEAAAKLV